MSNLNVSSLRYGRENESRAAKYYVQFQEKYGHAGIQIFPCGLVVNPLYIWVGASPDRILFDPTSNPPYGCLEIKSGGNSKSGFKIHQEKIQSFDQTI